MDGIDNADGIDGTRAELQLSSNTLRVVRPTASPNASDLAERPIAFVTILLVMLLIAPASEPVNVLAFKDAKPPQDFEILQGSICPTHLIGRGLV